MPATRRGWARNSPRGLASAPQPRSIRHAGSANRSATLCRTRQHRSPTNRRPYARIWGAVPALTLLIAVRWSAVKSDGKAMFFVEHRRSLFVVKCAYHVGCKLCCVCRSECRFVPVVQNRGHFDVEIGLKCPEIGQSAQNAFSHLAKRCHPRASYRANLKNYLTERCGILACFGYLPSLAKTPWQLAKGSFMGVLPPTAGDRPGCQSGWTTCRRRAAASAARSCARRRAGSH